MLLHCRPIRFRGNAVVFSKEPAGQLDQSARSAHTDNFTMVFSRLHWRIFSTKYWAFNNCFFLTNVKMHYLEFFKSENDPSPCLGKTVNPFETVKCWTTTVAMAFGRQRHNHSLKLCDSIWELVMVMAWDRQGSSSDSIRVSGLGASSTSA